MLTDCILQLKTQLSLALPEHSEFIQIPHLYLFNPTKLCILEKVREGDSAQLRRSLNDVVVWLITTVIKNISIYLSYSFRSWFGVTNICQSAITLYNGHHIVRASKTFRLQYRTRKNFHLPCQSTTSQVRNKGSYLCLLVYLFNQCQLCREIGFLSLELVCLWLPFSLSVLCSFFGFATFFCRSCDSVFIKINLIPKRNCIILQIPRF